MKLYDSFLENDLPHFEPDGKVGLLGTVNDDGLPHLTLITAMRAPDTGHLVFGQFCEGSGKRYAEKNKKTGFLIMGLDKVLWRGKALWTKKAVTGPEHQVFNNKPMWRYNSYFGIHTAHYLDLIGTTRAEKLPMGKIVTGVLKAALAKGRSENREDQGMNLWTRKLISKTGNLKFLSYIGNDGYPIIIPCLSAAASGASRVYIPGAEYSKDLKGIPDGTRVCLFAMTLDMEDAVVRGIFHRRGTGGDLSVDWVYNSMPPVSKQIFPPVPANAKVTVFD
ncbi:MAG: hypothetical protein JW760_13930 [Spirochaetales bacterium]|nr:hypothetical protein [Spirochaetales bacterium]